MAYLWIYDGEILWDGYSDKKEGLLDKAVQEKKNKGKKG